MGGLKTPDLKMAYQQRWNTRKCTFKSWYLVLHFQDLHFLVLHFQRFKNVLLRIVCRLWAQSTVSCCPRMRARSIVMSVSVCLSVCLCVCVGGVCLGWLKLQDWTLTDDFAVVDIAGLDNGDAVSHTSAVPRTETSRRPRMEGCVPASGVA